MEPISLCKGRRFCQSAKKKVMKNDIAVTKMTKDDAKTIQDEKDVQMEVPNAATEKNERF